jgi:amino acid adenylation domain-containing protein
MSESELPTLKRALVAIQDLRSRLESVERARHEPIAIVGMSCRFPAGASDPARYWEMLRDGRDSIREVPRDRWDIDELYDADPDAPGRMYTRSGGFLDGPIDRFDAAFFGITPREAVGMDPQQRLLLELAWEGIEDAAVAADRLAASRTGVYVGISSRDYGIRHGSGGSADGFDAYSATGNAFSVAAGRISYVLGLQGPNLALDTACSSSLVAVALAVQALRDGHCDQALAGGVNLMLTPETTIAMCRLRALSRDGRCRVFDAEASGYVRGEGGAIVMLKRLSDAVAAGDRIRAVIRGAAVNHDGRSSGLTVPNAAAQREVLRSALQDAGVTGADVDYLEAHGTGTSLGDPIELRAAAAVFGRDRPPGSRLAIGSVKTNVGHLEAAAGMAGLVKLVVSLEHGTIPPHLHFEQPTPHVDWDELPLVVPTRPTPWPRGDRPRLAGVSSFGFSGTNAHILVEEAPAREAAGAPHDRTARLLPLSARTPGALRALADRYSDHLANTADTAADICRTAAVGRAHFEHRLAVVGDSTDELRAGLDAFTRGAEMAGMFAGMTRAGRTKIAFLFTGHGAQYAGMGRQLYQTEPVFRAALHECEELLRPHLERPLLSVMHADETDAVAARLLSDGMAYSQPALFAIEYALAQLWRSWGVEPDAVLGHSVGEYAAAVIAGVLDLAAGVELVAARGRLMDALPEAGAMLAVFAAESDITLLLAPYAADISIAAVNAPDEVVVSGVRAALERFADQIAEHGIEYRWLVVAQAGHSRLLDPMLEEFERIAATVQSRAPRIPLVSCTTAKPVTAAEVASASYWRRHLREPVRFADAVAQLAGLGCGVFVEAGPHPALLGRAQQSVPAGTGVWLPSLRRETDDATHLAESLAAGYAAGLDVAWRGVYPAGAPVTLPTYPFHGERYWLDAPAGEWLPARDGVDMAAAGDWLYDIGWTESAHASGPVMEGHGHWLLCADDAGAGDRLAVALRDRGESCTVVRRAGTAAPVHGDDLIVDATDGAALRAMVAQARGGTRPLRGVVQLWGLDGAAPGLTGCVAIDDAQRVGCDTALHLVQALAEGPRGSGPTPRLWVVTRGAQDVGARPIEADEGTLVQAALRGFGRTVALEHPALWGGLIDLDTVVSAAESDLLADELLRADESEVAFRDGSRYVARVVPTTMEPGHAPPFRPRVDGAYLITGGLGALGLEVARWLASLGARRLVLVGRTPLPPRAEWKQVTTGPAAARIARIHEIELLGATVHTAALDVGDEAQLTSFLDSYDQEGWPPIRGVVHAAGALHDRTLLQLDATAMAAAFRPKARGAWLLHRHLPATLDFFVLFSSAAALTGSAGQANYAAANAFLDSLAAARRAAGLPALSIAWGPWGDVGMAASPELVRRRAAAGLMSIDPALGVALLGRLLAHDRPSIAVLPVAPARLRSMHPAGLRLLADLPDDATTGRRVDGGKILVRLHELGGEARHDLLVQYLRRRVSRITRTDVALIPADHGVLQLGMDSLMVVELLRELNQELELSLYPREIFERESLQALADYLLTELDAAVAIARTDGARAKAASADAAATMVLPKRSLEPLQFAGQRNAPAVFLLSSPRSGSTLLRIMLAGHPDLFCPPELHLLNFTGMAAWKAGLERSYLGEGLQRALMELRGLDAEGSADMIAEWVGRDLPVHEAYARLQALASPRLLVDKTPSYAADIGILQRAEAIFDGAKYIHLVRHPYAVVESFVRNRLDRIFDRLGPDALSVAEQVWADANSNTIDFLDGVDPRRHCRVSYEELVADPQRVMQGLSEFLGVTFVPELLAPYDGGRMADGVHASSMPIGDPNFHKHDTIEADLGDAWRRVELPRRLGGFARRIADELGYQLPDPGTVAEAPARAGPSAAAPATTDADTRGAARSRLPRRQAAVEPVTPVPGDAPLPLSFAQQRLYFLSQLTPDDPTYNMPAAVRLSGTLAATVLERALRTIIDRHEVLRTNLVLRHGHAVQEVSVDVAFSLPQDDLRGMPSADRDAAVRQIARDEVRTPFDLATDVKLRARLLRLRDDEHVLVITFHHIAADGWSIGVFLRELGVLYSAFAEGSESPLPPLPVQYRDYSEWQRRFLQGDILDAQLSYWKRQLAELPTLALPTTWPRPATRGYDGEHYPVRIPRELTTSLTALCRSEGVTLNMAVLAAFTTLLHRYTGQDDIVVGAPVAGRNRPEITDLIGFFVNTLVLRTDASGNPSFRDMLHRVRATTIAALENQDTPFGRLVQELQPARDLSRTPLFQVTCSLQNAPLPDASLAGLTFTPLELATGTAKFDLALTLRETDDGLRGRIEYSTDLFDRDTIGRLETHLRTLIEHAVASPATPLSDLRIVPRPEQDQLATFAAGPVVPERAAHCIPDLFEQQAARTPDACAVVFDTGHVTYAELDRRANQLAHRLREAGVAGGTRVAISLERSPDLVVAILATLKAGGAWVPIDPAYPAARVEWMLHDCAAPVLLTHSALAGSLPAAAAIVLQIDTERESLARYPTGAPHRQLQPADLAHVIYTSGSSGRPKGAMNTHGAVCNRLLWMRDTFSFSADDTFLHKSTISFDVAVWEILAPLLSGARVVLALPGAQTDPAYLMRTIDAHDVTVVQFVPSVLRLFVAALEPGACPTLRHVFSGGEALDVGLQSEFLDSHPAQLHNLYGPTETAISVCCWTCERGSARHTVPIGRPIANNRLHVLDPLRRLVPIGVAGELYIGGAQVGRGYLNQPELTAERFVADPFTDDADGRLYRTGDLARWAAEGTLEYLGRADQQVKLRGVRVEPGEVEAVLRRHPDVRTAVVVARHAAGHFVQNGSADALVACVVTMTPAREEQQRAKIRADLRTLLRAELPAYMAPASFIFLDSLPLLPNGKLDRSALQQLDGAADYDDAGGAVLPRTALEDVIAGIWQALLGCDRVGVHDSFYDLGGHSLLAMQAVSRIRGALAVDLPLRALFEAPTVAQLAVRVQALRDGAPPSLPPLLPVTREAPLPLSFAQQRLWFLQQMEPDSTAYTIRAAVRLTGTIDVGALQRSFAGVVRRHESLRTVFRLHDGEPVQVIQPPPASVLGVIDLSALSAEQRDEELDRRTTAARDVFDLEHGPLFRADLLRLSETAHVLLVAMHHIVTDGWSLGLLNDELRALYDAHTSTQPPQLPELAVQYADFAAWQRRHLTGEVVQAQLAYWRAQLDGVPALELPADRPRPPVQSHRGASVVLELPPQLSATLRRVGREADATLFMTLLAAFQLLLARLSGQQQFAVGAPIAGRTRAETEPLIGFFLNNIVLRADLAGDPTFRGLLDRVRNTTIDAYAHQDVPFEMLIEELKPARDLSRTPLFQVLFNMLPPTSDGRTSFGSATAELLDDVNAEAKFDLTLYVRAAERIELTLQYSTDLFDAAGMQALLRQYAHLLGQVADGLDHPVSSYSLVDGDSAVRLPDPAQPLAGRWYGSLTDRIAGVAARWPAATAIIEQREEWSYAELDDGSSRLAQRLIRTGVQRGDTVAILADRSAALVLALLGVMKAGAAFVVLDPEHPPLRLQSCVAQARPALILHMERAGDLPAGAPASFALPSEKQRILDLLAAEPRDAPAVDLGPGDLAYVAFTSGTTGSPRGIVGTHGPLSHFMNWYAATLEPTEADRFGMLSGLSHDPLLRDVFAPLCVGAAVCVPTSATREQPDALLAWLRDQDISAVHLTPALADALTGAGVARCATLPALRLACFGGEALYPRHVAALRRIAPAVRCVNFYGATETPQAVAWHEVSTADDELTADDGAKGLPLGSGIDGVQLLVLGSGGRLCGVAEVGEICVRTPYLAAGYLHDDRLTAERFVANPFRDDPVDRIYRTGDLGRYTADGSVVFVGRTDEQLKIRGYRVEPAGVEAVLLEHAAVRRAVVTGIARGLADVGLVAFMVPAPGTTLPPPAVLRAWLLDRLPSYMVPDAFHSVDTIPLTPSGKIDHARLHAVAGPPPDAAPAALRTPVEELVAGIWQDILGVERVGAHDNFHELGGHSLSGMQLVSRVRSALNVELPLRAIFEAPTVAQLAARIAALRQTGGAPGAPPLTPVPRDQRLPLSFAQQRLWFLNQLDPQSTAYNISGAVRLRGDLDVDALQRSFAEVLARHESLRTVFKELDGEPVQRILAPAAAPLEVVDLRDLHEHLRESALHEWMGRAAHCVFDLERGPLLRAWLLRLAERDQVLLLTMHHIVTDGWSMQVLAREVGTLYAGFASGTPVTLPPLPVQYADFAHWQRQWLQGEALAAQLGYWRDRLAELPVLQLPTDRPRPPVQGFRGAALSLQLPQSLSAALRQLSQRQNASLFMTLLSAFNLLLSRWSGQCDVVVGTPIANRSRVELEGLIGFFMNSLALRTDLCGDPSFTELLRRVRTATLDAYANQDVPFEKLIEELRPTRDLSRTPLFQVMFNLMPHSGQERVGFGDVGAHVIASQDTQSKFDLTLYAVDDDRIRFRLVYNTDLFDEQRMRALLQQLELLLAQVAAAPEHPISAFTLLTPDAAALLPDPRAPLAHEWCGSIVERVAHFAATAPDRAAAVDETGSWSYADLDEASNRLAHRLRAADVDRGDVVGIHASRSAALLVALLGILKTGAAFAILDPEYPAARLARCVAQLRPRGWVELHGAGTVSDDLVSGIGIPCHVRLPSDRTALQHALADAPAEPYDVQVGACDLAYVAFTSGTTGEPRGILGTHGPLSHFLQWHADTWSLDGEDRISMLSGLSHDPLLRDALAPLWVGGTACIPSSGTRQDPDRLVAWLAHERVTVAHLTPALAELLCVAGAADGGAPLTELRLACFGGDVLTVRQLEAFRRLAPAAHCVSYYGATETPQAMGVQIVDDSGNPSGDGLSIALGHGIDAVQLLVVAAGDRLCGIGELGEVYVRTPHLAAGYLGDERLTAERFPANPFTGAAGDRVYRTGDLARYLPDGRVVFAGRADDQVKIRGVRVEPAEIETMLVRHAAVRRATVIVSADGAVDARLVAFIVAEPGIDAPPPAALREHLRGLLPAYMVPAEFVTVGTIPLTRNGKVDRASLLTLAATAAVPAAEHVLPQTPFERLIAGLWQELLDTGAVGVHDNFYDLGGHSLLAVRFVAALEKETGVRIHVRELTYQTLRQLAAAHDSAVSVRAPTLLSRILKRFGMGPRSAAPPAYRAEA